MLCPACKHMNLDIVKGDDGVPLVTTAVSDECIELMKKHKRDVGNIFEEWTCPNFERRPVE